MSLPNAAPADVLPRSAPDIGLPSELRHLSMLDFWRALSISLVLAGHLLPLGPAWLGLNEAVTATGMVMFFTLSGFLITRFLVEDGNLRRFLIRRLFRIVPLAWAGAGLALIVGGGTLAQLLGNLLFYTNLPPFYLLPAAGHFWSLSAEVQFYVGTAILVALGGQRALLALPVIALAVTGLRITYGEPLSIVTWFRIDEILAGATMALVYEGWFGERAKRWLAWPNLFLLAPLVLASAHHASGPLMYARPYLSAMMIGASLYHAPAWLRAISRWAAVVYVAKVSYALYVLHGILGASWLGTGDSTLVKYAKRPLLIGVTFALAHLSTFHYELRWIALARRLTRRKPAEALAHG